MNRLDRVWKSIVHIPDSKGGVLRDSNNSIMNNVEIKSDNRLKMIVNILCVKLDYGNDSLQKEQW